MSGGGHDSPHQLQWLHVPDKKTTKEQAHGLDHAVEAAVKAVRDALAAADGETRAEVITRVLNAQEHHAGHAHPDDVRIREGADFRRRVLEELNRNDH